MKGTTLINNNPDPFPEISGSFAAASAQMRQRKVDVVAEMFRVVQEYTGVILTPEERATIVLSTRIDRTQHTPEEVTAELRIMAEDYRCKGNDELAAELNNIAALAEGSSNG